MTRGTVAGRWTVLAFVAACGPFAFAQNPGPAGERAPVPASHVLVVPFSPGGGADFVARLVAPKFAAELGEPVEIENRPGDDGVIAARGVAAAPADGATLLLGSTASLMAPALTGADRMLNPVEDFEPVALVATVPRFIAVHPSVPATSLDELIRLARADPGKLRCGWSDSLSEVTAREFMRLTGTTLACKDFDGVTPEMRADVTSGRINLVFESAFVGEMRSGALRALAVAGSSRSVLFPEVRTASEAGMAGLEFSAWLAILAPKGTPPATLARMQAAAAKVIAANDVGEALRARGYVVRPTSPSQARTFLRLEYEQWERLGVRRAQRQSSGRDWIASRDRGSASAVRALVPAP